MITLQPKAAVWLANSPYDAEKIKAGKTYIPQEKAISNHFDFSQTGGVVHGTSGSILSTLFNRTTGFAVIGKGRFSGDVALGIRGTKMISGRDWFSNLNTGIAIAKNQDRAHAGFQRYLAACSKKVALAYQIELFNIFCQPSKIVN